MGDDDMIRIMASENVTQFGKDSFKTYREATVAAVDHDHVMREVLTDPAAAQKFLRSDPQHDGKLIADIAAGGCPGERAIYEFFGGTLNVADIRLALQTYRETGELAARPWRGSGRRSAASETRRGDRP